MLSNAMILTYKRKRFLSRANLVHGIEASDSSSDCPNQISSSKSNLKAESNTHNEKRSTNNMHCFGCGASDANENLLDCVSCSGLYHLRCTELPFESNPQEKWECSDCVKKQLHGESMQEQVPKFNRARKSRSTQESDTGPMKLRSNKLSLSTKSVKDCSSKASSPTIDASPSKMVVPLQIDNSSGSVSKLRPVEDDSVSVAVNLNKIDCNDEHSREKYRMPLITFSRRVKKKQDVGEKFMGRNSKAEDKQLSLNEYSLAGSCQNEGFPQKCSPADQSNNVPVTLEQTESHPWHLLPQDKVVAEDADLETNIPGGVTDLKISGKVRKGLHRCTEQIPKLKPSQPMEHVPVNLYIDALAVQRTGVIGESVLVHENKQSNSANFRTSCVKESREKLAYAPKDSAKTSMVFASKDSNLPIHQELSVTPPSSACPINLESNKPSMDAVPEELSAAPHISTRLINIELNNPSTDVVPENFMEQQSSSAPKVSKLLLDRETDRKGKSLGWLETQDGAPKQTKNNTEMFSFLKRDGTNCGQTSNENASQNFVRGPFNKHKSGELMHRLSPLQDRAFLTNEGDHSCDTRQHDGISKKYSRQNNFLGLSLPLSSEPPSGSIRDSRSLPSPSLSGKDNHINTRQLSRHSLDENPFLFRHKQMVDNVMMGSWMLKERQASSLDKLERYSIGWSEDELDSLWIGVRRHGMDNWSAMLRDPKLFFFESRVAEDLADRWNIEQRKLFSGTHLPPVRLNRPDLSSSIVMNDAFSSKSAPGNYYGRSGAWSAEFQKLSTETSLSLGDVYIQKENVRKRNAFGMSGLGTSNMFMGENPSTVTSLFGTSSKGSVLPIIGDRNPIEAQSRKYAAEPSSWIRKNGEGSSHEHHQSAGKPVSNNLPHWLKEVFTMPPRSSDLGLPPAVASAHSVDLLDQWVNTPLAGEPPAPPKDSRARGILKRRRMAPGDNFGSNEPWMGPRTTLHSTLGHNFPKPASDNAGLDQNITIDLNKKNSGPVGSRDLVVIDSDASSEETISDDQSSRL